MSGVDLLLDIIALVLRETEINYDTKSDKIIEEILHMYENDSRRWKRGNITLIESLSEMIKEILENRDDGIDISSIKRRLANLLNNNEDIENSDDGDTIKILLDTITEPKSFEDIENEIKRLKSSITRIYTREKVKRVMGRRSLELNKKRLKDDMVFSFIDDTIIELEQIKEQSNIADEAVIGELDFSNDNLQDLKDSVVEKHIFKTGFIGLNIMTQGGIRTSEFTTVGALSHNYKTGLTLSIFASILLLNPPILRKKDKKPLAIWISFEDDLINIIESIYRIIFISENGRDPDLSNINLEKMVDVVKIKLQKTGFNVKILRINPTKWSYKDIFNKISTYNAKGYDVQICIVDYLDKLPTVGLYTGGPHGTEKKDLVKRVRNYMSAEDIAFITPWQLSSAAGELKKSGMDNKSFLSYIWDKSYYQGSSTLNTEIDLELFVNKVKVPNKGYWLNIHRGKHKLTTIIDDDDMSVFYPFPKVGMIPLDEIIGQPIYKKDPFLE